MSSARLDEHRSRLEAFAAELVQPYLERAGGVPQGVPRVRTKEFNDPVWGTLQVRAEEVFILDSPLLQRLRRVRQLGVVHFVYPAATHTRLEHSLGTLHQVQQLVTTLNDGGLIKPDEEALPSENRPISPEKERVLRIAALCHDVGHGVMSHVSEYALSGSRESENLRLDFYKAMKKEKQLSEIAAYYILGSPAFAALTDRAAQLAGKAAVPNLGAILQKLVIGLRIDDHSILLHELVSGPFDADKLDYITRDAAMCGVPVVTDVPRLVQKVRAVEVDSKHLPERLRTRIPERAAGHLVTGVARSGGRSLDELALARTLMFDKVYRHQKVRAAESMVFRLIEYMATMSDLPAAELILRLYDDEILSLTPEIVVDIARVSPESRSAEASKIDVICDLSRRLRERDLFVRGFAFAAVMTGDAYREDPSHASGLKRFLAECGDSNGRERFAARIVSYLPDLASRLDLNEALDVPGGDLSAYVSVSQPKPAPKTGSEDTGHAHLIDTDGSITPFQDEQAETMPWAEAYVATRDLGHVFCPRPLALLVFLAAETVLRQDYEVRLPASMVMYAKQDPGRVMAAKRRLADSGWYDDKPGDLMPLPEILMRADTDERVARVLERLAGYSGPTQSGKADRTDRPQATVHKEQILKFVQQFPNDEVIESALEVLEAIRVIGRDDMNEALEQFMRDNDSYRGGSCCPVGTFKDSGAVMAYFVGDVARSHDLEVAGLVAALNRPGPIVFVDDFIGTGHQLVDVFEALLGEERSHDLGEERESLHESLAELLRNREFGVVFASGRSTGAEHARKRFSELSLKAKIYVHEADAALPTLESAIADSERRAVFERFVGEIAGEALSDYGGKQRGADWIDQRRLGYGNTGLLVASTFNTPSASLTALWVEKEGVWKPILPRRRKD